MLPQSQGSAELAPRPVIESSRREPTHRGRPARNPRADGSIIGLI